MLEIQVRFKKKDGPTIKRQSEFKLHLKDISKKIRLSFQISIQVSSIERVQVYHFK